MKLRDHDQPCEHDADGIDRGGEPGSYQDEYGWWACTRIDCPGGREVTIDREAAVAYARKHLPGAAALAPSMVGLIYGTDRPEALNTVCRHR